MSAHSVAASPALTLSGSATVSGAATHADLSEVALDAVLFTVADGADLGVAGCNGSIAGLVVQQGGAATMTGATFQTLDDTTMAVSVAEGSRFTVANSRLIRSMVDVGVDVGVDDGSSTPFPCDGTSAVCVGEHDGSVVVEGPAVAKLALPLVCDVGTGVCKMGVCPALMFEAGSVAVTNGGTYPSTATYACEGGAPLTNGDADRTCELNGAWSGVVPTACLTCPGIQLPAAQNGQYTPVRCPPCPIFAHLPAPQTQTLARGGGWVKVSSESARVE
jgi:hypothetical protein